MSLLHSPLKAVTNLVKAVEKGEGRSEQSPDQSEFPKPQKNISADPVEKVVEGKMRTARRLKISTLLPRGAAGYS